MNTSLKTLIAALLLIGAGHVMAASSVDLTVRGLITPSACEPSLANGGVYDLGKVSAKDLNADKPTDLPHHTLQLAVTCDAATLMALEARDNREGSDFENDTWYFGLGLINGDEKLGKMRLSLYSPTADGVPVQTIGSYDGGTSWSRALSFERDNILSVGEVNTFPRAPVPVQLLNAELFIAPQIAPANGLTLTNEVAIDGSVTLTVRYL